MGDNCEKKVYIEIYPNMLQPEMTDKTLIETLLKEDPKAFDLLYQRNFPIIINHIQKNSGTLQDAEDIFQEAMVILLQKLREPNFTLTASIHTFLFAIAKNLWLKKMASNTRDTKKINEFANTKSSQEEVITDTTNEEKIASWLKQITINCQKILLALFFKNKPMEMLTKEMGWKNKHTAANQKYKCIEQIRKESKKK